MAMYGGTAGDKVSLGMAALYTFDQAHRIESGKSLLHMKFDQVIRQWRGVPDGSMSFGGHSGATGSTEVSGMRRRTLYRSET